MKRNGLPGQLIKSHLRVVVAMNKNNRPISNESESHCIVYMYIWFEYFSSVHALLHVFSQLESTFVLSRSMHELFAPWPFSISQFKQSSIEFEECSDE